MIVHTEIEIEASAGRVWSILSDFHSYPEWNPMIPRVAGSPEVGTTASIQLAIGKLRVPIRVEVLAADADRELAWAGPARAWMRRVASGMHYFRIEPLSLERVRFDHGEDFDGLIVPRQWRRAERLLTPAYEAMNRALKRRVES